MNRKPAPFLLFLLLLPSWAFSQLVFPENFRLGDTSQVHYITTERGDMFQATVTAWTGDTLQFRLRNGAKISLPVSEVHSLGLHSESGHGVLPSNKKTPFLLQENGRKLPLYGKLTIMSGHRLSFKSIEEGYENYKHKEVERITPGPGWGIDHNAEYMATFWKQKKQEGLLVGVGDDHFTLLQDGEEKQYPIDGLKELRGGRYRLPVVGHERSLFLTSTGFNLPAGQWEYRNRMILDNAFYVGLTDHLSIGVGAFFIIPFVQAKLSMDVGKYLHLSAGGMYIPVEGNSLGWNMAASIGTPDYFVNFSRYANRGSMLGTDLDLEGTSVGASARVGKRKRLFAEMMVLDHRNSDLFDNNDAYSNFYSLGMGLFPEDISITFGMGLYGPVTRFCFTGDCPELYQLFPFAATSVFFGK